MDAVRGAVSAEQTDVVHDKAQRELRGEDELAAVASEDARRGRGWMCMQLIWRSWMDVCHDRVARVRSVVKSHVVGGRQSGEGGRVHWSGWGGDDSQRCDDRLNGTRR